MTQRPFILSKPKTNEKAGRVKCLGFGDEHYFNSPDKTGVRVCPSCTKRADRQQKEKVFKTGKHYEMYGMTCREMARRFSMKEEAIHQRLHGTYGEHEKGKLLVLIGEAMMADHKPRKKMDAFKDRYGMSMHKMSEEMNAYGGYVKRHLSSMSDEAGEIWLGQRGFFPIEREG